MTETKVGTVVTKFSLFKLVNNPVYNPVTNSTSKETEEELICNVGEIVDVTIYNGRPTIYPILGSFYDVSKNGFYNKISINKLTIS